MPTSPILVESPPNQPPPRIGVVVADSQQAIREGLRALFWQGGKYEVVGETDSGVEAATLAEVLRPQVVVLDMALPDMDGIATARAIKDKKLPAKIVLLSTTHGDSRSVRLAQDAGVGAYVLKASLFGELEAAIEQAMRGGFYLAQVLLSRAEKDIAERLSSRERAVLKLIGEGKDRQAIAASLGLSARTVDTYRQRIMAKTGAQTSAELSRLALVL